MNVDFLDPAEAEMQEAISYYEAERKGLGAEFAEEVKRTIEESSNIQRRGPCFPEEVAAASQTNFRSALFTKSGVRIS